LWGLQPADPRLLKEVGDLVYQGEKTPEEDIWLQAKTWVRRFCALIPSLFDLNRTYAKIPKKLNLSNRYLCERLTPTRFASRREDAKSANA
jgi:hypothetical protein